MRYPSLFAIPCVAVDRRCSLALARRFRYAKKLFKFLSKILFTLSARSTCLFMPFFACFSLFRSYIARYAPLKKEKNILKKFYKNFKDINLNSF